MIKSLFVWSLLALSVTSCNDTKASKREGGDGSSIGAFYANGCVIDNSSDTISPLNYGLSEAKNGIERYWSIYNAHTEARKNGAIVDYSGIDSIEIEVPIDAKEIPLGKISKFENVIFLVTNKSKDFFLFEFINHSVRIDISKNDISNGYYGGNALLSKEKHLLSIHDNKPWVDVRQGYNYGHIRRDIILVEDGKAYNQPVMPYDNDYSEPDCEYYPEFFSGVLFSDLYFYRTNESTYKTFLCRFKGVDNLALRNITIITPPNAGENDQAISITDCTNVLFDGVIVNGTYSRKDYSGYGVSMNNVWNFHAVKMYGHGNWGVFGTNNINEASFWNCDLNRFDIHCYGRDVSFRDVIFRNRYNSFSSVYGTISFERCKFINFVPVVGDASYNAHVKHDIILKDCYFSTNHDTPQIIYDNFTDGDNSRPELSKPCLPNVTISNLEFHINDMSPKAYLFVLEGKGAGKRIMNYISFINIKDLLFVYDGNSAKGPIDFLLFNTPVNVDNVVNLKMNDVDIIGNARQKNKNDGRIVENIKGVNNVLLEGDNIRAISIDNK